MRRAVGLDPGNSAALARLALFERRCGARRRRCRRLAERALSAEPYNASVHVAVAELEHSMEDFKRARARVNEALSLEPDHAGALALQAELASSTRERSSHAALRRSMLLVARGCAIPRSRGAGQAARGGEGARGRQSPGAAGAAGRPTAHPTSTYLPNMNVPFSHPSELNPQKDGRKVRSRDELPLTLRPAAGPPPDLQDSPAPKADIAPPPRHHSRRPGAAPARISSSRVRLRSPKAWLLLVLPGADPAVASFDVLGAVRQGDRALAGRLAARPLVLQAQPLRLAVERLLELLENE